jgi:hypothetical protein
LAKAKGKGKRQRQEMDLNNALNDLWNQFFNFILIICPNQVIFVQNLGIFDGFFIYPCFCGFLFLLTPGC